VSIFKDFAPKYWAKNLPAIPLKEGMKRPAVANWSTYCLVMPTPEERDSWLAIYPDANIGLALGPASGIVILDIDSDDPRVHRALDLIVPDSPWKRVGAKGFAKAYRFNNQTTQQILNSEGKPLVEILGKGRQIVLNPSIHPDTGKPYVANCDLFDVVDLLPILPPDVDALIRGALEEQGLELSQGGGGGKVSVFVPAGQRDNNLVAHAGILARGVARGERTLLEALAEIKEWVESFTEKIAGDSMSVEKAQSKVVEFLLRDIKGPKRIQLANGWDRDMTDEDKRRLGLTVDADVVEWNFEKAMDFLTEKLSQFPDDNMPQRTVVLEECLDRVSRSKAFNNLDEERLIKFIATQYADYSVASLRKRLSELKRGEMRGEDHTELAEACLKDLNEKGEIRFHNEMFWMWNGAYWRHLPENEVKLHIAKEYGHYPLAKRGGDHSAICGVMRTLCMRALKETPVEGVNFANGFLTEDLRLLPHNPSFGATSVLPIRYMPELADRAFMWMNMLSQYWGKDPDYDDKVAALQEAFGATLFGQAVRYQRAFLLLGMPASGKSRIIQVMAEMMPPEAKCSVSPVQWHDRFMPAQMDGKLFNMAGELPERSRIRGDVFKQIVCGEPIQAQHKNKPPFQLTVKASHWFASNHTPKTQDTSAAFNRRWLIWKFNHPIDASQRIVDIDKIVVAQEAEAVAAWAVEGYMRLKKRGDYTIPASHETIIQDIANENNSVRYFLSSSPRIKVGRIAHEGKPGNRTLATSLHDEYFSFCLAGKVVQRVPLTQFNMMLGELCHEFDFQQLTVPTSQGQTAIVYEYITVVKGQQ
jgi:putative DNA primase/helicase